MKHEPPNAPELDLSKWSTQLRKGGLGLAVLAALWPGRLYGLEILRRLAVEGAMHVPEGTIYPLLSRLKSEGLVASEWVESEAGHPRKYYELTAVGRQRAGAMGKAWREFSGGLDRLLSPLAKGVSNDHS